MKNRTYIAIDLKSFYASVECVERGLDPLTTNLVVADLERTEKTICLAVSPSLKSFGIPGRARLFEVVRRVKEINAERQKKAPGGKFAGKTSNYTELMSSPSLALDYIVARPRMAMYLEYSAKIYKIYLKYVAPEDIHVYSIDEVFMDVTGYLETCKLSAREFAMRMVLDVLNNLGITATAGIGTNLYLCKIAMDIGAKHLQADENGVRIAELDETSYRQTLWEHRPLTDFWRVGRGYAKKLEMHGLFTMGDIARCSLGRPDEYYNEELLYKMFGVNAELLIDHAWGWEPCTIKDVKAYRPRSNSLGSGQVLQSPYSFDKAKLIVMEMTEQLVLELVEKGLVTDQITLTVGYDIDNLRNPELMEEYGGDITIDFYGRAVPKHAHGSADLGRFTSSTKRISASAAELFDSIADRRLLVRRLNVTANNVMEQSSAASLEKAEQLDLFGNLSETQYGPETEEAQLARERQVQRAMLDIKRKFGKNAILKGMNLEEGATAISRNSQIGGHRA